ncbi:MAG: polyribonucleotide nucleotidyltransferase [Planctomycetes bacterium]|nr:polyribonucleotide nucleotidyltransferase [Planctomycetota bacterium]
MTHRSSLKLAGTECSFETGRIARQASGAVVARCGDSVVLATVVGARAAAASAAFFPLTVEYRERLAAAGRIPGSYNRREGRITDHEVLVSRLIDRTLRSLFPDGYLAEVQVQVTVLSAAPGADLTTLATLAACAAMHVSPIPCAGPAAGMRIAVVAGNAVAFPTEEQRSRAELDLVVSAGPEGLVMVEGGAQEAAEEVCVAALEQAFEWLERMRRCIDELAQAAAVTKWPIAEPPAAPEVPAAFVERLGAALRANREKAARAAAYAEVRTAYIESVANRVEGSTPQDLARHAAALDAARHDFVREEIAAGRRPDGRSPTEIRPIWSEVGWLPRAHGSAIFTRGETQALVSLTLGTPEDALRIEDVGGRREERFILHYGFPPYSVGETRPLRGPGRREIGHGHLARRGLEPVLPDPQMFSYTLRIDSEISESNGSSSMATVCGASLALFQAGVPMQRATAGIAMGLIQHGDATVILSDIVGEEDHLGDMDLKVVGTEQGITALQLDNKIGGLRLETLRDALQQARIGRMHILAEMAKTIAAPAAEMPPLAPRVSRIAILPDSVGILVGPRGAQIKQIQAESGARITVDDHGTVLIYATEGVSADKARRLVQQAVGVLEAGKYYRGTVTGVKDFGVFVRVNEVSEGLVPNDQVGGKHDARPKEGDAVVVRVLGADERGRLRLSLRAAEGIEPGRIEY